MTPESKAKQHAADLSCLMVIISLAAWVYLKKMDY